MTKLYELFLDGQSKGFFNNEHIEILTQLPTLFLEHDKFNIWINRKKKLMTFKENLLFELSMLIEPENIDDDENWTLCNEYGHIKEDVGYLIGCAMFRVRQ